MKNILIITSFLFLFNINGQTTKFYKKNILPLDCGTGKGVSYQDLDYSTTDIFIGKMIQQIDTVIDDVWTGVGEFTEKKPTNRSTKAFFLVQKIIKSESKLVKKDTITVKLADPKYTINVWDFTMNEEYLIFGVKKNNLIETCLCCLTIEKKEYARKRRRKLMRYFKRQQ